MKTFYTTGKLILLGISLLFISKADAQYSWTQKANFTGGARFYSTGFSIGKFGFIGCGSDNNVSFYNDFYKWNQTTNTWSAITSYPGAGYHYSPVGFSIEGYGYVGLGWTGSGGATDLWRYDTATNSWTAMATFPGVGRYDAMCFVVGHKAYVIGGSTGGPPYKNDVWMYDAHQNTWTQMNNSPVGNVDACAAFAIGNHGYIGGGDDGSSSYNAFYKYDTATDAWTSIASYPIALAPTGNSRAFVLGSKAYVCTGSINYSNTLPTGYAYDTTTGAWTEFTNMGAIGIERDYSAAFTIGNCGYIGTGKDSLGGMLTSFWQWGPPDTTSNCNTWKQEASFTGSARFYAAGFSIGKYGFIGCGSDNNVSFYNDFYKWNQTTNIWSAITSYPGSGYHYSPVGFSIEGYGYVGLGWTGSGGATDLWRYDTTTNAWTAMATFPGVGRYDAMCFVMGHKAYIIGGSTGGPPYKNDVWMYDAHQNTWTQMNNSPVGNVDACATFAIGNHGYIGGGDNGSSSYNAFYKYDSTTDTWTSIAPYPIALAPTGNSRAFVVGSTAYVCTGSVNYSHTLQAGYAYDTVTGAWTEFTNMGANGIERSYAAAFTIGNCGYIGTGKDSLGGMLQDLWGYCPCQNITTTYTINNSSIQMNVYPNPSSGLMHIKYSVSNGLDLEFRVMDMFGRVLNSYKINGQEQELTVNETSLSNGMYFYQVLDSGKLVSSGKFIIAK